jgi:hypothetical protein
MPGRFFVRSEVSNLGWLNRGAIGASFRATEMIQSQGDFNRASHPLELIQSNGFFQMQLPNGTTTIHAAATFSTNGVVSGPCWRAIGRGTYSVSWSDLASKGVVARISECLTRNDLFRYLK